MHRCSFRVLPGCQLARWHLSSLDFPFCGMKVHYTGFHFKEKEKEKEILPHNSFRILLEYVEVVLDNIFIKETLKHLKFTNGIYVYI